MRQAGSFTTLQNEVCCGANWSETSELVVDELKKKTNNKTQTDAYEVIILRQENNNWILLEVSLSDYLFFQILNHFWATSDFYKYINHWEV